MVDWTLGGGSRVEPGPDRDSEALPDCSSWQNVKIRLRLGFCSLIFPLSYFLPLLTSSLEPS
jgi:hypothetical protein